MLHSSGLQNIFEIILFTAPSQNISRCYVNLLFLVLCLYLVRRSLCHCKTPAETNDIVHISAEFLKMKVFPHLLTALIAESILLVKCCASIPALIKVLEDLFSTVYHF